MHCTTPPQIVEREPYVHFQSHSDLRPALLAGVAFLALATSLPAFAQQIALADTESVIVTGTRVTGMTAADSAAPITVIGSDALSHVGQPNLIQALAQITPVLLRRSAAAATPAT